MILEGVAPGGEQLAASGAGHLAEQRANRRLAPLAQRRRLGRIAEVEPGKRIAPGSLPRSVERERALAVGNDVVVGPHPRGAGGGSAPPIGQQLVAEQEASVLVGEARLPPDRRLPDPQIVPEIALAPRHPHEFLGDQAVLLVHARGYSCSGRLT